MVARAGAFPALIVVATLGRGSELGHSFGALRHGVLGELSGEHEADRGLDLAAGAERINAPCKTIDRSFFLQGIAAHEGDKKSNDREQHEQVIR